MAISLNDARQAGAQAAASGAITRRGPLEWREEWLLAQPRLTLSAASPDLVPAGELRLRVDLDWGNDFGWRQSQPGETPEDRRFLVDGEHRTLNLTLRRGLGDRLEVALRLPIRWRGGGVMDGLVEWVHRLGFPGNGRDTFLRNQLRVEGRSEDSVPLRWTGSSGVGLGKLDLGVSRSLVGGSDDEVWRLAATARVALPTATGTFASDGAELAGQLVAARSLGRSLDLYFGVGATHFTEAHLQGLDYVPTRGHGFLAIEWRPWHAWSLLAQFDGATRLVAGVADYPGVQSYLRFGAKLQITPRWTLEGGFSENVTHQQTTTDFGIALGLTHSFYSAN